MGIHLLFLPCLISFSRPVFLFLSNEISVQKTHPRKLPGMGLSIVLFYELPDNIDFSVLYTLKIDETFEFRSLFYSIFSNSSSKLAVNAAAFSSASSREVPFTP
jgi:hypothetical protein